MTRTHWILGSAAVLMLITLTLPCPPEPDVPAQAPEPPSTMNAVTVAPVQPDPPVAAHRTTGCFMMNNTSRY